MIALRNLSAGAAVYTAAILFIATAIFFAAPAEAQATTDRVKTCIGASFLVTDARMDGAPVDKVKIKPIGLAGKRKTSINGEAGFNTLCVWTRGASVTREVVEYEPLELKLTRGTSKGIMNRRTTLTHEQTATLAAGEAIELDVIRKRSYYLAMNEELEEPEAHVFDIECYDQDYRNEFGSSTVPNLQNTFTRKFDIDALRVLGIQKLIFRVHGSPMGVHSPTELVARNHDPVWANSMKSQVKKDWKVFTGWKYGRDFKVRIVQHDPGDIITLADEPGFVDIFLDENDGRSSARWVDWPYHTSGTIVIVSDARDNRRARSHELKHLAGADHGDAYTRPAHCQSMMSDVGVNGGHPYPWEEMYAELHQSRAAGHSFPDIEPSMEDILAEMQAATAASGYKVVGTHTHEGSSDHDHPHDAVTRVERERVDIDR